MATVEKHYDELLSDVYSWMFGGFKSGCQRNVEFFKEYQISPSGCGLAIDLGAGCGFQSIPLAEAGYSVTAIDIDAKLLGELESNAGNLPVHCIRGDLIDFDEYITSRVELFVCMTDTLIHLESKEKVLSLFSKVFAALDPGGKFIMTFRDLTSELTDVDRFLPIKSDENMNFTCFLEYEQETVKVHDIVYKKQAGTWHLFKSFYRKLRLSGEWVSTELSQCGFSKIDSNVKGGFVTIIASR